MILTYEESASPECRHPSQQQDLELGWRAPASGDGVFAFSSHFFPTIQRNLWHMWVHPHGVDTTGALDLGGASTQISFVSEEKMEPNASDTVQVSLYGYTYTLYTHSFQCYGRNEAEKKFLAILLQVLSGRVRARGGGLPGVSILTPVCRVDRNNFIVSCDPGSLLPPSLPVSLSSSVGLTTSSKCE